jgi:hypothetical protein
MNRTDILFYGLCVPLRIGLAILPLFSHAAMVWIGFAILSLSFLTLWAFRLRMNAFESVNRMTWWAPGRIVHAILYGIAAYLISPWCHVSNRYKYKLATSLLMLDVVFGTAYRTWHRYLYVPPDPPPL